MKEYKVHTYKEIKPEFSVIKCFIADDQYVKNPVGDILQILQAVCWIAQTEEIQKKIAAGDNVTNLIADEVAEFNRANTSMLVMLYQLYEHQTQLVDELRNTMYQFIKDTYLRIAD